MEINSDKHASLEASVKRIEDTVNQWDERLHRLTVAVLSIALGLIVSATAGSILPQILALFTSK